MSALEGASEANLWEALSVLNMEEARMQYQNRLIEQSR